MDKKQYERDYYKRNREKRIANVVRWRESNPDKHEAWRQANRRRHIKLRAEMIDAYGGKCVCCSESIPEFLTVDHILHNGQEHRKSLGSGGTAFLSSLKKLGWPKETLRLLCMNCNWANRYGRSCPHSVVQD